MIFVISKFQVSILSGIRDIVKRAKIECGNLQSAWPARPLGFRLRAWALKFSFVILYQILDARNCFCEIQFSNDNPSVRPKFLLILSSKTFVEKTKSVHFQCQPSLFLGLT